MQKKYKFTGVVEIRRNQHGKVTAAKIISRKNHGKRSLKISIHGHLPNTKDLLFALGGLENMTVTIGFVTSAERHKFLYLGSRLIYKYFDSAKIIA